MTAPEEKVASARPDYSDSHTLLNPSHAHDVKPKVTAPKKTLAKAPLPPKKPSVQLVAASSDDAVNFPLQKNTPAKKAAPKAEQKVTIAATPMKPAPAAPKYVPKSRPSMPAVPSGNVEKASLDPFALPTDADDSVEIKKPTPGERMIDQALSNHMIEPSTADIEATMSGGKATSTKPFEMAALPPAAGTPVPIISMEYLPRLSALQTDQRNTLKTEVVSFLQKKTDARLQIQAFADGKGNDSDARQLSLSRALEIRAFLLDSGIDPSRIDVRALGSNTTEKPIDRVDLKFTRQN